MGSREGGNEGPTIMEEEEMERKGLGRKRKEWRGGEGTSTDQMSNCFLSSYVVVVSP